MVTLFDALSIYGHRTTCLRQLGPLLMFSYLVTNYRYNGVYE